MYDFDFNLRRFFCGDSDNDDELDSIYRQYDIHGNRIKKPINFGTKISYVDECNLGKNIIDLILLDIVMPKMDGITMLKKLKDKKLKKRPEIIMLTNLSGTNTMADAVENGSL